jgi:hypothetical protein
MGKIRRVGKMNKRRLLVKPKMGLLRALHALAMTGAALLLMTHFYISQATAQTVINDMTVAPCPACGAEYGLPKTGQEVCYDAAGTIISCTGSGNDAEYADPEGPDIGYTRGEGSWANWNAVDGSGRFTNNGDGTITDNATGLEWVANPAANPPNIGGTYTWANALTTCEGLDYAGHQDWRLPNVRELQSIVDYGTFSPSIDTNFFTSQSYLYWSSTTVASLTSVAWDVDFSSGYVSYHGKALALYIRPVRSSQ